MQLAAWRSTQSPKQASEGDLHKTDQPGKPVFDVRSRINNIDTFVMNVGEQIFSCGFIMAISVMFIIFAPIFHSSKSLESPIRSLRASDPVLFTDEHTHRKLNIKKLLLDNLNIFSQGNENEKLEILDSGNQNSQKYSTKNNEIYMQIERPRKLVIAVDEHSNIAPQLSHRKILRTNRKRNTSESDPENQQSNDWQRIRERRLRFYKAFRRIHDMHRNENKQNNVSIDGVDQIIGNTNKTIVISHRRKKNGQSFNDPMNITYNDWETFITDYSKIMPQYNRRSSASTDQEITEMGKQLQKEDESYNSSPRGYLPPARVAQSPGPPGAEPLNPFDYQQLLTNFNLARETVPNNGRESASERLPPPPNPRSTEASVHTVQVYPPTTSQQQQLNAWNFNQNTNSYDNNAASNGNYYQKTSGYPGKSGISQLATNDYDGGAAYMTETDPSCNVDPCGGSAAFEDPFRSSALEDERCNSPRLRQIILQNIVERDAEASKRLIYSACEMELSIPCNVICGIGFYSYTARATQFCLAAALDVSCYAFIPACDLDSNLVKKRRVKKRRRIRKH